MNPNKLYYEIFPLAANRNDNGCAVDIAIFEADGITPIIDTIIFPNDNRFNVKANIEFERPIVMAMKYGFETNYWALTYSVMIRVTCRSNSN